MIGVGTLCAIAHYQAALLSVIVNQHEWKSRLKHASLDYNIHGWIKPRMSNGQLIKVAPQVERLQG